MTESDDPAGRGGPPVTRTFTIFDERGPRRLSAEAVLALLEEGMITLDVDVMLHGGTSRGPLRRWIRELVFIADEENRAREAGSVHYRSLFETAFDDAPIGMVLSDLCLLYTSPSPRDRG